MDYGNILNKAWQITWRWKALWILGFLASLGRGGGGSSNSGFRGTSQDFENFPADLQEIFPQFAGMDWAQIWQSIAALVAVLVCVLLVIFIILWVVSVIARGGLIAGVQQVEEEGSTTFRRAWVAGRRKFWTLFGLGVLAAIPMIIIGLLLAGTLAMGIVTAVDFNQVGQPEGIPSIFLTVLCLLLLLCCLLIPLGIILEQIRIYGERAAILEDKRWIEAFKRGWTVLRENLGRTIVLWLIFFAIGVAFFIVTFALVAGLSIPFVVGSLAFDEGNWMIAPVICGGLVFMVLFIFLRSVMTTFVSAGWTLVYRELTGVTTAKLESGS